MIAEPHEDDNTPGEMIATPIERLARLMRGGDRTVALNPAQWEALRYLSRANRFSNSPGALTRYLGATKGTISQTVIALGRKGFVRKSIREGEKRSVSLVLTPKGEEALAFDPWVKLATAADSLGGKTRRRLAKGLSELLALELQNGRHPSFGNCLSCRFFREKGRDGDIQGPHLCMLLGEPLSPAESQRICVEHEPA
jgi:DNA-binding MarR family transcriptional regulator